MQSAPLPIGGNNRAQLRVPAAEFASRGLVCVDRRVGEFGLDLVEFACEVLATVKHAFALPPDVAADQSTKDRAPVGDRPRDGGDTRPIPGRRPGVVLIRS